MKAIAFLKQRAGQLRIETHTLYLVYRDPRAPWYAKVFMAVIVAYALSPIDLIPDFIPVLGYVDDLIIVPAGVFLALKMVPKEVVEQCRQRAGVEPIGSKAKWVAAVAIITVWLLALFLLFKFIWRLFDK